MLSEFEKQLSQTLEEIKSQGLYKTERIITSPQDAHIAVAGGKRVLNMCANNYLGLADHPDLIKAAKEALDTHGLGMASVRFICGTQDLHKQLEAALTKFLGTEETILYPSAFDANGGLFETLLTEKDAIISDELNHASIIDGIRLCKAQRFRYKHNDMADLEAKLKEASGARFRLIATDGCFSMDGTIADLKSIVDLAEKYDALTMIDDAHATGFLGKTGRGTHEYRGVMGKIDIITGTLGKALGGASGGFTSGRKQIVDLLRHRSCPHPGQRRPFARGFGICGQSVRRNERRTEITWSLSSSAARSVIIVQATLNHWPSTQTIAASGSDYATRFRIPTRLKTRTSFCGVQLPVYRERIFVSRSAARRSVGSGCGPGRMSIGTPRSLDTGSPKNSGGKAS